MLPKDVFKLISDYNEIGIFVAHNKKIQWFNGKRFERLDAMQGMLSNFTTYENRLYFSQGSKMFVYANKTFMETEVPKFLFRFSLENMQTILHNNHYQLISINHFKINGILESSAKQYPGYGYQLINYGDDIYVFGTKSEKFNVITQIWTAIADMPQNFVFQKIYIFDNLFYIFDVLTGYCIYNPKLDLWHTIK